MGFRELLNMTAVALATSAVILAVAWPNLADAVGNGSSQLRPLIPAPGGKTCAARETTLEALGCRFTLAADKAEYHSDGSRSGASTHESDRSARRGAAPPANPGKQAPFSHGEDPAAARNRLEPRLHCLSSTERNEVAHDRRQRASSRRCGRDVRHVGRRVGGTQQPVAAGGQRSGCRSQTIRHSPLQSELAPQAL